MAIITKDLIADYGAVCNVQDPTCTVSCTSGQHTLHDETTNRWSGGDVGKLIQVYGAGSGAGEFAWIGTIASVAGPRDITITTRSPETHCGQTLSSAAVKVVWGANDSDAWEDFHTAYGANTADEIHLTCGSGTKKTISDVGDWITGVSIFRGIRTLRVNMPDAYLYWHSDMGFGAGAVFRQYTQGGVTDPTSVLIDDVSRGSRTVTSLDANIDFFSAGDYVQITGIDLQGFGDPANPGQAEYNKIISIDTGSKTFTLETPLAYAYRSTWPSYDLPPPPYEQFLGGPGTMYNLFQEWNCDHEYEIGHNQTHYQTYASGRRIVFRNVTDTGTGSLVPTTNGYWLWDGCTQNPGRQIEIDKSNGIVIEQNGTSRGWAVQSYTSAQSSTIDNVTSILGINGTPARITITNSTLPVVRTGNNYGGTDEISISDSAVATFYTDGQYLDFNTYEAEYIDGVVRLPYAVSGVPFPLKQGSIFYWAYGNYDGLGPLGTITDITRDDDYQYFHTDLAISEPPSVSGQADSVQLRVANTVRFTGRNNTGDLYLTMANNATAGAPYYEYAQFTWTESHTDPNNGTNLYALPVFGRLVRITIDVTDAYSGSTDPLMFDFFFPNVLADAGPAHGTPTAWNPGVDLRTAGTRIIEPSAITGKAGADSNLITPPGNVWIPRQALKPRFTANISGDTALQKPSVTVTIITDIEYTPASLISSSARRSLEIHGGTYRGY